MSNRAPTFLVVGLLASFVLGGCASYAEIKNKPADRRYEHSNTLAEPLSACMHDRLLELGQFNPIHRVFDHRRDQWFLLNELATTLGGGIGSYSYSLSFMDEPAGVIIDLRSLKSIWGTLAAPEEYIEQSLRECAAATRTAE